MIAPPQRQRGVALLVALLVVALAVILIAALLDRGELAFARTRNTLRGEQAEAYAQGLELYAAQVLLMTIEDRPDTHGSAWALPLPPQDVPSGLISASMSDLNGCFNLNNLAVSGGQWNSVFDRLLRTLGLDPAITPAVQRWMAAGNGPDDSNAYLALPVPYRPRRGVFVHVSELRLVAGVTGEAYAKLAPYVCALPPGSKLNVNTASAVLLSSLGKNGVLNAEKLWNNGQARYTDLQQFAQEANDPTLNNPNLLDVSSTYFLARGDIVLDGIPFTFYSLIERGGSGIRVLERSRGGDDALSAPAPIAAQGIDTL